jgi:hypothetical protein
VILKLYCLLFSFFDVFDFTSIIYLAAEKGKGKDECFGVLIFCYIWFNVMNRKIKEKEQK